MGTDALPEQSGDPNGVAAGIAGLSILKGLVLYGAVLVFTGFYCYFMAKIAAASGHRPPNLDATMVSAAAALAGVLGLAFALVIGVPTDPARVNQGLAKDLPADSTQRPSAGARIRQILSLEPGGVHKPSYPLTAGIWMYASVGAAVAVTYLLNQDETPPTVRTLALAFAGYVIGLVTAAYGIGTKSPS